MGVREKEAGGEGGRRGMRGGRRRRGVREGEGG